jgi:hypothetical protein
VAAPESCGDTVCVPRNTWIDAVAAPCDPAPEDVDEADEPEAFDGEVPPDEAPPGEVPMEDAGDDDDVGELDDDPGASWEEDGIDAPGAVCERDDGAPAGASWDRELDPPPEPDLWAIAVPAPAPNRKIRDATPMVRLMRRAGSSPPNGWKLSLILESRRSRIRSR